MRNSKIIILALVFIFLTLCLNLICNYIFIHPNYVQNLEKDLKKQGDIDVLIVGDSLAKSAYNASLISEELGINAFNFSQSGANLETMRLQIEEAFHKRKISLVVLGWNVMDTLQGSPDQSKSYYSEFFAYSNSSKAKIDYFPHLFSLRYTDVLSLWSAYFDPRDTFEIIKIKNTNEYKNKDVVIWHPNTQPTKYLGQGSYAYVQQDERSDSFQFKDEPFTYKLKIDEKNLKVLQKLKAMCDEHGAKVIAVVSTCPKTTLKNWKNRTECINENKSVLKKYAIQFFDANTEDWGNKIVEDKFFRDEEGHIFYPYVNDYTMAFCNLLKDNDLIKKDVN